MEKNNWSGLYSEPKNNMTCHCCGMELDTSSYKPCCNFCESGEHSEKQFCVIHNKNIADEARENASLKIITTGPDEPEDMESEN